MTGRREEPSAGRREARMAGRRTRDGGAVDGWAGCLDKATVVRPVGETAGRLGATAGRLGATAGRLGATAGRLGAKAGHGSPGCGTAGRTRVPTEHG